jgi:hypothetical protein
MTEDETKKKDKQKRVEGGESNKGLSGDTISLRE